MENVEQSVEQTSEETSILEQAYADAKAMQESISATTQDEVTESEEPKEEIAEEVETVVSDNDREIEPVEEDITSSVFKQPIMLKDRKLQIPVNNMQELITLAQQGLNYTQKTQQLSSHKNTVDYLGKHNITMQDLETLASIKNGDKQAIGHLAKSNKIDLYDIDSEASFSPSDSVKYYEPTEVDIVANEILQNEPVAKKITEWVSSDVLPNDFVGLLRTDANALRAFAEDVDSGIADRIIPIAMKNYAINKGNFLNSYIGAAQFLASQGNVSSGTQEPKPIAKNASSADKAKVSISSGKQSSATIEEDFDVYENNLSDTELMRRIQLQADRLRNNRKG